MNVHKHSLGNSHDLSCTVLRRHAHRAMCALSARTWMPLCGKSWKRAGRMTLSCWILPSWHPTRKGCQGHATSKTAISTQQERAAKGMQQVRLLSPLRMHVLMWGRVSAIVRGACARDFKYSGVGGSIRLCVCVCVCEQIDLYILGVRKTDQCMRSGVVNQVVPGRPMLQAGRRGSDLWSLWAWVLIGRLLAACSLSCSLQLAILSSASHAGSLWLLCCSLAHSVP